MCPVLDLLVFLYNILNILYNIFKKALAFELFLEFPVVCPVLDLLVFLYNILNILYNIFKKAYDYKP